MKSIVEIENLVRELNKAAHDQSEGATTLMPFGVTADGEDVGITFFNHLIWSSDDDIWHHRLHNEVSCWLESLGRLDIPKLIAILPEPCYEES